MILSGRVKGSNQRRTRFLLDCEVYTVKNESMLKFVGVMRLVVFTVYLFIFIFYKLCQDRTLQSSIPAKTPFRHKTNKLT